MDTTNLLRKNYNSPQEEMSCLISWLNEMTRLYDLGQAAVPDYYWDSNYYRLVQLETETHCVLPGSPTQSISFEVKTELDKIKHEHLMLSLDKTKDVNVIASFLGNKEWVAMGKMDGLTCSLTYENGELIRAETRGDGEEGEDILHNAKANLSIPNHIPYKKRVVIDGEIICDAKEFAKVAHLYKNPRNYATGSIRLLDSYESRARFLTFIAWDVIELINLTNEDYFLDKQLLILRNWGFQTTPFFVGYGSNIKDIEFEIDSVKKTAEDFGLPIDGVVFKFNDLHLRDKLGHTAHHFNNAIAFKFFDDLYDTKLRTIEWSMGRTGVLTPVAIFDAVDADGSIIERASLHNLSVMEELLGIPFEGQKLKVFKANMIIPQVYSAEKPTEKPEAPIIPLVEKCPVCGGEIALRDNDGVKIVVCTNPSCSGKLINRLDHFFGLKGLNAKGISKATFEKLISWGWLTDLCDMYNLDDYIDLWKQKPGFGAKSVNKILDSLKEASSNVHWEKFLCALGIPLIGSSVSKELAKVFSSWEEFRQAVKDQYQFYNLPSFGLEKHNAIMKFDYNEADRLAAFYITFAQPVEEEKEIDTVNLSGKVFVVTGKLQTFKNRAELQADIEKHGGRVTGSVSKNTSYLINNDVNSTSSKNMQAKKLGIPIISELDYRELALQK